MRELHGKNCLGLILVENFISVTQNQIFGIMFAMLSDLSWRLSRDRRQDLCEQEAIVSQFFFCDSVAVFACFQAYDHGLKGPQKPKTDCDNSSLRSYRSPLVFIVRSGPMWRQDLAILSPEGPRDNTCQLRFRLECSLVLG